MSGELSAAHSTDECATFIYRIPDSIRINFPFVVISSFLL